jgi:UDP-N-acetylmuramoyl-tripeptide--D-alanyl-D-alanine ligase
MKPLTVHEVHQAVGGRFLAAPPPPTLEISAVCTDTRKRIPPGALFVCIRGERFDAHGFLPQAAAQGAIAAIVSEPPSHRLPNLHLIQVADARAALGKLATHVRRHLRAKVIGVAGSNGKTSTKHLIGNVLGTRLTGTMSPKSFNNDIGVPLTVFASDPADDFLVLELGTNHPGEIRCLANMALPDIGVITNCGAEHLEFLGDLMGVRQENACLIEGLPGNGRLVVNGDDEELLRAIERYPKKRTVTFGFKKENDLYATEVTCDNSGVRFSLNGRLPVFVPLLGRHTACNSLAAIAVGRRLGLSEEQIVEGLAHASGPEMRLELQEVGGITLVNDAYNANPNSMRAALETLADLSAPGRRIAVLGDMRELGRAAERYHNELGEFAASCGLHLLVCVGEFAPTIAAAAQRAGMAPAAISCYTGAVEAAEPVARLVRHGDMVLIKASRAIRLERVAEAITRTRQAAMRRIAS